jgi:ferredoxin-NADP reductase
MTPENLARLVPDLRERHVYLCAAPRLAKAVRPALVGAGVRRRNIHQEEFAF